MSTSLLSAEKIVEFVLNLLVPVMHTKRARSVANAVAGAVHADRFTVAAVGRAMARVRGKLPKHSIKQFDRLLSNSKVSVEAIFKAVVPWLVGRRDAIVVSMDWTEYARTGHSRLALNLVTKHGRATPLVWKTFETTKLKRRRNDYEDEVLWMLKAALPEGVAVTILADRGFGDTKLYRMLEEELGWCFVVRFRAKIAVESANGEVRTAGEWVPGNGQARRLHGAQVTKKRHSVDVVCVKKRGMKDAWCLATNRPGVPDTIVKLYGRRFTCEENFRDEKDPRFGFGMIDTQLGTPERRDRFLAVVQLAMIVLTLVGAAGESLGCDRTLKANTTRRRTHSLLRQGREYVAGCAHHMAHALRSLFERLLRQHPRESTCFGLV